MKKATWYYAQGRKDQFKQDVENLTRCGVGTVLVNSPDEETTQSFQRLLENKGPEFHVEFSLNELYSRAMGRPEPAALPSRPEEYRQLFPAGAKPYPLCCWSGIKDFSPLTGYLRGYVKNHPFVKGISLDHIRYPNTVFQETNPCECEGCKERRRPWLGRDILSDEDIKDPSIMYMEVESKVQVITRLVQALSAVAREMRVRFSSAGRAVYAGRDTAFNPRPTWGYGPAIFEGQDWVAWCRDGLLDDIHIMNYSTDMARFERLARQHKALLTGSKAAAYEALGIDSSAGEMSPELLRRQIQLTRDIGLDGVTMFWIGSMTEEHLRVLERA